MEDPGEGYMNPTFLIAYRSARIKEQIGSSIAANSSAASVPTRKQLVAD
jgi:hypothetical protein